MSEFEEMVEKHGLDAAIEWSFELAKARINLLIHFTAERAISDSRNGFDRREFLNFFKTTGNFLAKPKSKNFLLCEDLPPLQYKDGRNIKSSIYSTFGIRVKLPQMNLIAHP